MHILIWVLAIRSWTLCVQHSKEIRHICLPFPWPTSFQYCLFCIRRTLHWSRGAYGFLMSLFFLLSCRANLPAVIKWILLGMHKGPIESLIWPARSSSFRRSCRGFWAEPGAWLGESPSFGSNSCCYCMIEVVLEEGLCSECLTPQCSFGIFMPLLPIILFSVTCRNWICFLGVFLFFWSLRMWIKLTDCAWPFVHLKSNRVWPKEFCWWHVYLIKVKFGQELVRSLFKWRLFSYRNKIIKSEPLPCNMRSL